ncbi:acyltransferase [Pseudomonas nicosulfuronedens]|uniref:Acyltransferase n=1 Tax=Pseudomonas nicosulfuronedens TaxID=2571105 RepID=A0A5R9R2F2_9PSED|nr:acyltransferase [Pseudomonas nicosulfuronedens]MDH1009589.1 acyltransferase [Pseudomonas nicosulfuronedens]MDH1978462.1 acyltransferase [Pseudomonas nicosulfuronedens]MDH2026677.1 acyltransferase [Pseudomonas nicosulfuronedens]TLX76750.1 acyltransferase [Pseudomonas nicosulfuronedens]
MSDASDVRAGLRQPASYLPELESLRGWAILLVVGFHYFGILGLAERSDNPMWMTLLGGGNTGVTLFFVLSGFLLSRPFLQGLRDGQQVSIQRFYTARFFRIVPLYYAAVLLAWVMTQKTVTFKALLFIPIGFQAFPFSVPWWSLCTEIQFYLVLPWVMWLLRFAAGRWLVAAALLAWGVAHVWLFHSPGWLAPTNFWENSLFGRFGAFLAGAACAGFSLSRSYAWLRERALVCFLLLIGCLLGLGRLWLWFSLSGERNALQALPMYHNIESLLWGGAMLGLLALSWRIKALLANPLLDHFGRISYSLYLIHVPVQFYCLFPLKAAGMTLEANADAYLMRIAFSLLLSWGLAWLSYRLVELPFLRLKAHLATYSRRAPWARRAADA